MRARLKHIAATTVRLALRHGMFTSRGTRWSLTGHETPVLMCLWNRPERIGAVLEQLDRQDHPDGVRLYLWNNRRSDHGRYLQAIDAFRPAGSSMPSTSRRARSTWGRSPASTGRAGCSAGGVMHP
ncbi:hypothetical protein GCM10025881_10950 [Pseudolysinimonas kribbensis]|uniref:Uncharacterized protein n=1 Tax=Pseudolysinimonas kribbensis TaxID=433641 RepID=A0ABQ6K110_9MICO|nr:hypothetical protein [Pseudolysinimonas kribbensis]GMA94271.1 hypothetical protein GCM10025881_10950 [Pseudolysinimonas kribbensis]